MRPILPLFSLLLASCEVNHYHAQASADKWVHEDSYTLGSSNHSNRSDGSSRTYDGQKSFSDFTTAAGAAVIGIGKVRIENGKQITTRAADTNATRLGIVKEQEATKRATAELGAKAPIVVPEGQQVIFPP